MTDPNPRQKQDRRTQGQPVERHPSPDDPTAVDRTRESDATTINNGGLGGGRPEGGGRPKGWPPLPRRVSCGGRPFGSLSKGGVSGAHSGLLLRFANCRGTS
jgi:hypothetical protein